MKQLPIKIEIENIQRGWPVPTTRPVMRQVWSKLLFAHWPIAPAVLRPLIPAGLELDTFEGQAWVGVVPFLMSGIRFFGLPPFPYFSHFLELNVRTYVTVAGKPGVYFFSLDASQPTAVTAARLWYNLRYFRAKMSVTVGAADKIHYLSQRKHRPFPPGDFEANYGPKGAIYYSQPGTLEHFLTARYCLYSVDRRQRIYRGEINHSPWPLQPAFADLKTNTVAQSWNIVLPESQPLLYYTDRLDVLAWPIRKIVPDSKQ